MSPKVVAWLIVAVVLTTGTLAALVAGILSGALPAVVLVNAMVVTCAVAWLIWAQTRRLERLAEDMRSEVILAAVDGPHPLTHTRGR